MLYRHTCIYIAEAHILFPSTSHHLLQQWYYSNAPQPSKKGLLEVTSWMRRCNLELAVFSLTTKLTSSFGLIALQSLVSLFTQTCLSTHHSTFHFIPSLLNVAYAPLPATQFIHNQACKVGQGSHQLQEFWSKGCVHITTLEGSEAVGFFPQYISQLFPHTHIKLFTSAQLHWSQSPFLLADTPGALTHWGCLYPVQSVSATWLDVN